MNEEIQPLPARLSPLILASASPRRKDLLERLGFEFDLRPSRVDELLDADTPERNAQRLAGLKARAVVEGLKSGVVIGCDTVVAVESEILGKPADEADARRILSYLSGKVQRVISGLCLIDVRSGIELCGHEVTWVHTRPMSPREIDEYIATGECFGKAGAYAIQETGDRFIDRLEGSFDNVVGFPTELFIRYWNELCQRTKEGEGV